MFVIRYLVTSIAKNSDFQKALFYYNRSLTAKLKTKAIVGYSLAFTWILVMLYNGMGSYSRALDYYFKSLNIDNKLHDKKNE
ncbi:hypothetical protein [Mucilaginibacter sp.]